MQFKRNIFSVPIYQGEHNNKVFHKKLKDLCYKWKPKADGLVSGSWEYRKRSNNQAEKDKEGVTTFLSENLRENSEWDECTNFICDFSRHMLSETHDLTSIDVTVGNLWSTFYPQGGYIPQHIHGNCLMSGVYYVQAEEGASDLIFTDPAWIAKSMLNVGGVLQGFPFDGVKFHVPIKENLMVLFPSWLPHHTLSNKSVNDRIIISFNLMFDIYKNDGESIEYTPIQKMSPL